MSIEWDDNKDRQLVAMRLAGVGHDSIGKVLRTTGADALEREKVVDFERFADELQGRFETVAGEKGLYYGLNKSFEGTGSTVAGAMEDIVATLTGDNSSLMQGEIKGYLYNEDGFEREVTIPMERMDEFLEFMEELTWDLEGPWTMVIDSFKYKEE